MPLSATLHRFIPAAILPTCETVFRTLCLLMVFGATAQGQGLAIRDVTDKSIGIFEGNRPVLVYNHGLITAENVPESDHRRTRACYIHPIYGLDGEVLTEDFPTDHYHHHGAFWTWPHVGVGGKTYDLWAGTGMDDRFVAWLDREVGPDTAVLGVENGWFVGPKKVMIERVWLTVHAARDDSQAVDVRLVLIPTDQPVSLQGAGGKSYGGLTVRFTSLPRQDVTITVPSGRTSDDLKMTRLEWVDYTGKYPGRETAIGATMMIHPTHPDFPPMWLTRHYGPQCIGWPGIEAQTFPAGRPIQLDYRIYIHRGLPEVEQLRTAYQDYTAATKPHPGVEPAVKTIDKVANAGPFKPQWSSLETYQIPQWYKDAKFGIFIHWGAYSVPAFGSEWYPRQMYIDRARRSDNFFEHHVKTYGPQKTFGYKDFIPDFRAEKFDAGQWARLFKQTGARYVIPVAEHHDGFPMYDCSYTRWNAAKMGPKRDVIGELAAAVRGEGMKFGVSSHRAFNWMYYVRDESFDNADPQFADLYGRPMPFLFREDAWDYKNFFPPQDDQFKDDWLARACELVDKYQPDVFWFDFGITPNRDLSYEQNSYADHLKRFAAYYYNRSTRGAGGIGVINYKFDAFPEKAAVLDKERSKMDKIRQPFWQTDTAVSASSWGYTKNQRYKTPDRLVDDLVDIVSKNGCLLLNVGPRPDGTIPAEDQAILKAIGGWLDVNGEAIYDTTFWSTFGEGPTAVSTGHVSEASDKPFTAEDIRFTTKDGVVYAVILAWPENGHATIRTLATGSPHWPGAMTSVELLGSSQPVVYERTDQGLRVELPKEKPCDFAYVLKLR